MRMTQIALSARLAALLALPACTAATTQPQVVAAVTQDAGVALQSYQAALGLAQVALQRDPALLSRINAVAAQAAPFVAAAQAGSASNAAATSLGALAAELLVEAAPFIAAVSNG